MEEIKYSCAICHAEVFLYDGLIERTCEHEDAGIIADLVATAYGDSQIN